jgi:metal-responsive CopG/Arc/MetJ family transcriptional regulator
MKLIKSTINIPANLRAELDEYIEKKIVPSFSSGINAALELYLKELRRIEYDKLMALAGKDKDFIQRTMECHEEMTKFESQVNEEW